MTTTHENVTHQDVPAFVYEEVDADTVSTSETVEEATEAVLETAEDVAEMEEVDLASLSPEQRLSYFQKLADDNAKLRRETAALKTALTKATTASTPRRAKNAQQDERILTPVIKDLLKVCEWTTTEKSPAPFLRYVGSVNIKQEDETVKRYHATIVVKEAKRG
jgi:hypothetical protein